MRAAFIRYRLMDDIRAAFIRGRRLYQEIRYYIYARRQTGRQAGWQAGAQAGWQAGAQAGRQVDSLSV